MKTAKKDELCNTFGMEDCGSLRDWNEEYQCCNELPSENASERLLKSRAIMKTVSDFIDSATLGATAIVQGQHRDGRAGHLQGRGRELQRVRCSQPRAAGRQRYEQDRCEAFAYSVHLCGRLPRDTGRGAEHHSSILPGDSASSLVYKSIDNGESIASGHDIHELMKEASKKLFVAEREVKPLGVGGFKPKPEETEVKPADDPSSKTQQIGIASTSPPPLASTKEPVNICGPVECKGIVGSDKRHYVLDLIRLTPRDANWYEPEEEKRAIEDMKVAALAEATRMKSGT